MKTNNMILTGTAKEILSQLYGMIAYYGNKATLKSVIENENKIGNKAQCRFDALQ